MTISLNDVIGKLESAGFNAVLEEGDVLRVTSEDGLDVFIHASGDEVLVETLLFPFDAINNVNELNEKLLRASYFTPLTSLAIKDIEGQSYYIAFGSLSASSDESQLITEVETLCANVDALIELASDNILP